jgi:tetratricopeptide (TPR) repeat protein
MNSHSPRRLSCYIGHSIFYSSAKGVFVIFALSIIFDLRVALAVDFKTYLERARSEIFYHKEIIREDPLDAIAYFELGRAFLALGKHEEEVEAYREAIQLNPKYISAHYNLSIAYDLLKDGPNAIKHMLRALNLSIDKRNHVRIRKVQRQIKRLYLQYPGKLIRP